MWFFILASLVSSALAAASDPACTADTANPPVKLSPAAIACEDADPAICKLVFGVNASTSASRSASCIKDDSADATKPDPNFKKLAIEKCAKHCGYCCLRPEYNCENKPYAQTGLDCSKLADRCTDPTWKPLIAENCPSTCGLCLAGGCVDNAADCASQPTICFNANFVTFAKENCARTCNKCPETSTSNTAGCVDTNDKCAHWARNGKFCTNTFYQSQWDKCRKSCGKC